MIAQFTHRCHHFLEARQWMACCFSFDWTRWVWQQIESWEKVHAELVVVVVVAAATAAAAAAAIVAAADAGTAMGHLHLHQVQGMQELAY